MEAHFSTFWYTNAKVKAMIFLGLGANLPFGPSAPAATLAAAMAALRDTGVEVAQVSPFYRCAAWPNRGDPQFVNAVARLWTQLTPENLLNALQETESKFGRVRGSANAPRTLDLDILDFGGRVQAGPPALPHPRMAERAFVLVPLRDLAPDWRHPIFHKTADELISRLPPETPMPERL